MWAEKEQTLANTKKKKMPTGGHVWDKIPPFLLVCSHAILYLSFSLSVFLFPLFFPSVGIGAHLWVKKRKRKRREMWEDG